MKVSNGFGVLAAMAVIAACSGAKQAEQTAPMPVESEAAARKLAESVLKAPSGASGSYRVDAHPDGWVVWNGPTPQQTDMIVFIDRKTGRTGLSAYKIGTISEKL